MGKALLFIGGVFAIFAVAYQRMADGGKLRPDLMGASGEQLHFNQRTVCIFFFDLLAGANFLCAGKGLRFYPHLVFGFVFIQPAGKGIAFLF